MVCLKGREQNKVPNDECFHLNVGEENFLEFLVSDGTLKRYFVNTL
jgi:hypothetical protein